MLSWIERLESDKWYDTLYMEYYPPILQTRSSPTASVISLGENYWRLEIPANNRSGYHLAQLDDHGPRQRSHFRWQPPLSFSLQARVSSEEIPGTWGFGLWNDPFSFMIAYNRLVPRLPALPDAAWFFFASPQNYLSIRNDLPANQFLAATFRSTPLPFPVLALASPLLALTAIPGVSQFLRKPLRGVIKQDAAQIHTRVTDWHSYRFEWEAEQARFYLDEVEILQTKCVPHPPLSLVLWIDNQYAALPPKGRLKFGVLANPEPAWMEIKDVRIEEAK